MPGLDILEIGSWQGGSTCWLLSKVVSKRSGSVVSIDTFEGSSEHQSYINKLPNGIKGIYDSNICLTGHANLVTTFVGDSGKELKRFNPSTFDLVYYDGADE